MDKLKVSVYICVSVTKNGHHVNNICSCACKHCQFTTGLGIDIPPGAIVVDTTPLCSHTLDEFIQDPVMPDCKLHYRDYIDSEIKLSDPYYGGASVARYIYLIRYPGQKMTKILNNLVELFSAIKEYDNTFLIPVTKHTPAGFPYAPTPAYGPVQMPTQPVYGPIQMPLIKPPAYASYPNPETDTSSWHYPVVMQTGSAVMKPAGSTLVVEKTKVTINLPKTGN